MSQRLMRYENNGRTRDFRGNDAEVMNTTRIPALPSAAAERARAMPYGLLAYFGAGASLMVCYGKSILAAIIGGASADIPYFNVHVQAALMWLLGALAVYGLFLDRKKHGKDQPVILGIIGVVIVIAALYGYYHIIIEVSGYILLLAAAFLNQNISLQYLNRQVAQQARDIQTLNEGLEQRVAQQVGEIERLNRLKRFLAPEVAKLVAEDEEASLLQSHRAYISTLFCDLRDFTRFSVSMEPEEVMAVLQQYHENFGQLVARHGGTIDHRAGDGLMVFFNDPLPVEEPVLKAVELALDMRQCFAEMNEDWSKRGYSLGFGAGIASGYATLGVVGHEGRYDYTANGNAVNLAARLCDTASNHQVLISDKAFLEVEQRIDVEYVDPLTLKGFPGQTTAYNVLGLTTHR